MRKAAILSLALCAAPALAQEDDRDFLTAFLEDSLSGAGREVTITGFAGALSSQARIDRLTIADDDGIWLTISGVTLDWSRSALLSGALTVSELSADEIVVARLPDAEEGALPAPEASPFRLPDLPLSIAIDRIAAARIALGPDVLGQAVEGRLEASATLAGGEGRARLDLLRTGDGPEGEIVLDAAFANATGQLDIDLRAAEAAGGIVVSLLGVPGAPAATLEVQGQGPLDDHTARLRLATDGEDRLAGTVTLGLTEDGRQRVLAEVAGNLAPLFLPDYAAFFGTSVGLSADARQTAAGGIALDRLEVTARTLRLTGQAVLSPDGLPETLDVQGTIADPEGAAVLLPLSGAPTRIDRAAFALTAAQGGQGGWTARLTVAGLDRADLGAARLGLEGSGRIGRTPAGSTLGGTLRLTAEGLAPADPGLASALGDRLEGAVTFHSLEGSGALSLPRLDLAGDGFALAGRLGIEGLADAFQTTGSLTLTTADLSRFATLAGRPLAGEGRLRLEGSVGLLSGAFDLAADLSATGLRLGIDQADRLLSGASTLRLSVLRDESGTTLRAFDLAAGGLAARATGRVATAAAALDGEVTLANLAALDPRYGGSLALTGSFRGTADEGTIALGGTGRSLRLGSPEIDRLLAGETRLSASLTLGEGDARLTAADLANSQFSLGVSALAEGLGLTARLTDLGLLVPDLQGPLSLSGTAAESGDSYRLALDARGPGGIDARIQGLVAANGAGADLRITGSGRAALGNLFIAPRAVDGALNYDLRLNGPFQTGALSGRVTLSGGRLTDPGLGLALEDVEAMAQISGGEARLSATARLSTGGRLRLDGPVGLTAPFAARLDIGLDRLRLFDPDLYEATMSGGLRVEGPLAGGALLRGALTLAEADLRVSSSGFASAAALLDLTHVAEPAPVRETRRRAGLIDSGARGGAAGPGRPFLLDLVISAPSRVFLRGRGIDAELGGTIRLGGTTAAVVPSGGFSLIRGRLDILGRRLVLSEADLQLEGSFVPTLRVAATAESDGVTSSVRIDGAADDPVVTFTSVPERPQEEVLARLLFGRDLGNLSAFQAAQLANAVAVLAGRGGEGIVSRLRKGFGLDDLDLATSDDGSTALTAGKYLNENLYTEIQIEQGGQSRINLNLDLRDGVTLRGRLGDDGDTGVGIFIERDY
jgi:translocation and assembly module TamB